MASTPQRHFVSQAEADRYEVDLRIHALKSRTALKDYEMKTLEDLRSHWLATFQPIYRLPDDILAIIFEAGLQGRRENLHFSFTISQVTSRFRRVALATPTLWTAVRLERPASPKQRGHRYLHRSNLALSRAGLAPLDLYVTVTTFYNKIRDDLGTFIPLLERSQLIQMDRGDIVIDLAHEHLMPVLPRLRSLELLSVSKTSRERWSSLFTCTPQLLRLHLEGFQWPSFTLDLPCLQTLWFDTLINTQPHRGLDMLLHCTRMPSLRTLMLGQKSTRMSDTAIAWDKLLDLQSLVLYGMHPWAPWKIGDATLVRVLSGMPKLKYLTLGYIDIQNETKSLEVMSAARSPPPLVEVSLKVCRNTVGLLKSLIEPTPEEDLRGNLQKFYNQSYIFDRVDGQRRRFGEFPEEFEHWAQKIKCFVSDKQVLTRDAGYQLGRNGGRKVGEEAWGSS